MRQFVDCRRLFQQYQQGIRDLHLTKFCHFCVAPKMFEFVKISCFRVKNVHHCIEVVHQNPLGVARAFGVRGRGFEFFLYFFVDTVGDGLNVGVGIAFADDEKICRSVAEFPKVQLNNLFAFFVTDTLNDGVVELFELRLFCPLFGNADQI